MDMMEKEGEDCAANATILETDPAGELTLRTFDNETDKHEYQFVKLTPAGMSGVSGLVVANVPVTLPEHFTVQVDQAGRLTLQVSNGIEVLPGEISAAGYGSQPAVATNPDMPPTLNKKSLVQHVFSGSELTDGTLQLSDCLHVLPDVSPMDCMTVRTSLPNAVIPHLSKTPHKLPKIVPRPDTASLVTLVPFSDSIANLGSAVSDDGCSQSRPVTVDNPPLPSIISATNVEMRIGPLILSRGTLVYTDQSRDNLTIGSQDPEVSSSALKDGTTSAAPSEGPPPNVQPKVKKKGGWPKGKKRKKDLLKEPNVPKAPTTAYSLYLNEQLDQTKKKHYKMPFPEIIKIVGGMWTKMSAEDKQKYITDAKNDKKRYIDELRAFQHSETYQTLLRRQVAKKIKDLTGVDGATIDPDVSASVLNDMQLEDDDPNDLLCKICDQCFSSVHNKKEHMYGKQHLLTLTGKLCEIEKEVLEMETSQQQLSGSSLIDAGHSLPDGTTLPQGHTEGIAGEHQTTLLPAKIDIEQFKDGFMELNLDREIEVRELRCRDRELFEVNMQLNNQYQDLEETLAKTRDQVNNLERVNGTLGAKIEGLRMVPTVFGVINF